MEAVEVDPVVVYLVVMRRVVRRVVMGLHLLAVAKVMDPLAVVHPAKDHHYR